MFIGDVDIFWVDKNRISDLMIRLVLISLTWVYQFGFKEYHEDHGKNIIWIKTWKREVKILLLDFL
jgi:hypothetical protein